jgi:hypothetical protein
MDSGVHVMVKTSLAERKPNVLETPIGSHMTQRKKSSSRTPTETLKTAEYTLGGT